jgi:hypothetical protein
VTTWLDGPSMAASGGSGESTVPVNAGPVGSGHPSPPASDLLRAPVADRNGDTGTDWPAVAARLGLEVAVLRRERDELDREVERLRGEVQRAAAYAWDLECEREELRHDLEEARAAMETARG